MLPYRADNVQISLLLSSCQNVNVIRGTLRIFINVNTNNPLRYAYVAAMQPTCLFDSWEYVQDCFLALSVLLL